MPITHRMRLQLRAGYCNKTHAGTQTYTHLAGRPWPAHTTKALWLLLLLPLHHVVLLAVLVNNSSTSSTTSTVPSNLREGCQPCIHAFTPLLLGAPWLLLAGAGGGDCVRSNSTQRPLLRLLLLQLLVLPCLELLLPQVLGRGCAGLCTPRPSSCSSRSRTPAVKGDMMALS